MVADAAAFRDAAVGICTQRISQTDVPFMTAGKTIIVDHSVSAYSLHSTGCLNDRRSSCSQGYVVTDAAAFGDAAVGICTQRRLYTDTLCLQCCNNLYSQYSVGCIFTLLYRLIQQQKVKLQLRTS